MCNQRKNEERKRLLNALLETLRHDDCCSPAMTRSEALNQLGQQEEELLQVEEAIRRELCAVRQRRNSRLPINLLPTELLGFIFGIVVDSAPKSFASAVGTWPFTDTLPQLDTSSAGHTRDYDFHYTLALTAVCKHWRETSISTARLWSTIFPTRSKFVPLQIERSREAGFDVILTTKQVAGNGLHSPAQISIPHWPEPLTNHLRQLIVQLDAHHMQQWAATLSSASAPHLETLCISVTRHANVVHPEKSLFAGVTPRLRMLTLSGFVVPWDSTIFTDLRELTLRQHKTLHRPTMPEFLDLLGRNPRLRRLALELSGPQAPPADFEYNTSIELNALTHVDLHDIPPHVVALIVHHTKFPPSTQLSISHGPHTLHAVDTHVLSMFTRFRTPLLRARELRLLPWNIGTDKPGAAYTSGRGLLEMHVHPDLARVKDVVDGIVRTELRFVHTLLMENLSIADAQLVVGLLKHIHTVERLFVLDCTFSAVVVRALADPDQRLSPLLRELTISGHEVEEADIRALIECRKGAALKRLSVRDCTRLGPEFVDWVESGAWL